MFNSEKYYIENKERIKKYNRKRYRDNPEKGKEYTRRYYRENIDKVKKQRRKYREKNIERERERKRIYYKKNHEKLKELDKKYRKENLEKERGKDRLYYKNNSEKIRKRHRKSCKKYYKTDIRYRLNQSIGGKINRSLKGNKAGRHWEDLVGYTLDDLMKHLKKTMPKGYDWQDYLEGRLHIDHIIPKSVFNFDNANQIDFQRCWALSNLQLLPAKENLSKSNKLIKPFQLALKICLPST